MRLGGWEKKERLHETARCRHCIMATCALFISLPTTLYAHHGTVTTRAMSEAALEVELVRWSLASKQRMSAADWENRNQPA